MTCSCTWWRRYRYPKKSSIGVSSSPHCATKTHADTGKTTTGPWRVIKRSEQECPISNRPIRKCSNTFTEQDIIPQRGLPTLRGVSDGPIPTGRTLLRSSALYFQLVAGRSLRRRQTRRQHAEWRTGNVVKSHFVAELHRRRFSAMLAANPNFQVRAGLAPAFSSDLHQLSNAFLIERVERILLDDPLS